MSIQPAFGEDGVGQERYSGQADKILKRYAKAKRTWDHWKVIWTECYVFALPYREQFDVASPGMKNTMEIYDETAVVTLPEMASKIGAALIPSYQRWASLMPGPDIPEQERDKAARLLEEVTGKIFHAINNSNFYSEAHESLIECGIGTGILEIWPGTATMPIRCNAVPLTEIVLDIGPFGNIDAGYRMRSIRPNDAYIEWPEAKWPEEFARLAKEKPDDPVKFICGTYRDWSFPQDVVTRHCVIWEQKKALVWEKTWRGIGSSPMIPFRWSKAASEIYGRGPVLNALSSIKTCNLVVQLLLDNAEIQIGGLWQLDSNGAINPENINLVPGTIVPKMPGTTGLEPVTPPGKFDLGQFILENMRQNIKRAMYSDQFAPVDQTPMSATEVALRQQDLAERIGASFGRLQNEFVVPVIQRVAWLLKEAGKIELPAINGKLIKVEPISPLARSQRNEDIMAIDRYLGQIVAYYGQEALMVLTKPADVSNLLAELHGVPKKIVPTAEEVKAKLAEAAQMAQQQQAMAAQGGAPQ